MEINAEQLPIIRRSVLHKIALGLGIGTGALGGIIGITVGTDYVSKKYQPIRHLAAYTSGKSIEELRKEGIERSVEEFFKKYDSNRDGIVDGKEYLKGYDLDGNGVVDKSEYKKIATKSYDELRF